MAEFCLECWNKINDSKLNKKSVIISKDYDLCEGCGEIKHVVIRHKKVFILKRMFQIKFQK